MEKIFEIAEIQGFWETAHGILPHHDNRILGFAGMMGVQPTGQTSIYLPDLLQDVLQLYCDEPLTPSMAGGKATVIPMELAWNEVMRLLATPLWMHVVRAGNEYLRHAQEIIQDSDEWTTSGLWMILIAVISHDLGKLRKVRPIPPDKYKSKLHPQYGAIELGRVIGIRLPEHNKQKLLNAVLHHHDYYNKCEMAGEVFTTAVIAADRLARDVENDANANRYFRRALMINEVKKNEDNA